MGFSDILLSQCYVPSDFLFSVNERMNNHPHFVLSFSLGERIVLVPLVSSLILATINYAGRMYLRHDEI
jgi:hypothetical protein